MDNPTSSKKFTQAVKESKKMILKSRLKLLINAKGLKESDFYNELQISKQLWYFISWGIWEPSNYLKVKIAKGLSVDSCVIWGDIDFSTSLHKIKEPPKNLQNDN